MSEAMTIDMDGPVLRELEMAASRLGRTRESLALDVISAFVAAQNADRALIEAGLAQLDRGERVSQEEMERLADSYLSPA